MNIEPMGAIVSGLIGASLAAWLCHAVSRWVPQVCDGKSAASLLRENHAAILTANVLFMGGIVGGIAIYVLEILPDSDWRGMALGAGSGSLASVLLLPLWAIATDRSVKQLYVAYAISQRAPIIVVYAILALCIGLFAAAVVQLLF